MSNPLDDYLTEKAAGGAGFMSRFAKGMFGPEQLGGAANIVGAGVAATAGAAAARKVYRAATKGRDFRELLSANADLAEEHGKDPAQFNRLYSSFRAMNPQFAADPIVAGTYMRQMVMAPATAGHVIVESLRGASTPQEPPWLRPALGQLGKPEGPKPLNELDRMKLQQMQAGEGPPE